MKTLAEKRKIVGDFYNLGHEATNEQVLAEVVNLRRKMAKGTACDTARALALALHINEGEANDPTFE